MLEKRITGPKKARVTTFHKKLNLLRFLLYKMQKLRQLNINRLRSICSFLVAIDLQNGTQSRNIHIFSFWKKLATLKKALPEDPTINLNGIKVCKSSNLVPQIETSIVHHNYSFFFCQITRSCPKKETSKLISFAIARTFFQDKKDPKIKLGS